MSAAAVNSDGAVMQLDGRAPSASTLTADDVKDADKLARLVNELRDRLAEVERAWSPRRTYFRDVVVTATAATKIYLHHNFAGRVNWWVARWDGAAAATAPAIDEDAETDANQLVLVSGVAGTATICVEASGA